LIFHGKLVRILKILIQDFRGQVTDIKMLREPFHMTTPLVVEEGTQVINRALACHSVSEARSLYLSQGEFLTINQFLPQSLIDQYMEEVEALRPQINRNFIPTHKKGGSISYYLLQEFAPSILALYHSATFIEWLSNIAGATLLLCPEDDPHACALYFYTEAGDHIGYHYDTSYYKGARYTVLIGLTDRSTSKLLCRLHTRDFSKTPQDLSLATDPGLLVFFNGDRLYHAVSPLGDGEERIVLTLQYVTDPRMGTFKRWFSNMKDAVGYFGLPALFRQTKAGEK